MNMDKLRQILRLSDSPAWAMRNPDQQVAPSPEAPMPLKQGGIPNVPGTPQPPTPGKMNPQAMKQAADSLLNTSEEGSSMGSAEQGPMTSLTSALRDRRNARKMGESFPKIGSIGYSSKGGY